MNSRKASPSSVFWRRITLESRGIGAYLALISTSMRVRAAPLSSERFLTLPMFTPARRTSASSTRVVASGTTTVTR